jgi:hypothetical protein
MCTCICIYLAMCYRRRSTYDDTAVHRSAAQHTHGLVFIAVIVISFVLHPILIHVPYAFIFFARHPHTPHLTIRDARFLLPLLSHFVTLPVIPRPPLRLLRLRRRHATRLRLRRSPIRLRFASPPVHVCIDNGLNTIGFLPSYTFVCV